MHRFLIGLLLPFIGAFATVFWTHGRYNVLYRSEWIALILLLLVTPALAGLLALAFVHGRRRRRWLIRRAPGRMRAAFFGLVAGVSSLALVGGVLFLNYLYRQSEWDGTTYYELRYDAPHAPEVAVVGVCTFIPALMFAWLMPRRRPGICVQCNYDIRGSLDFGRCPECGRAIEA